VNVYGYNERLKVVRCGCTMRSKLCEDKEIKYMPF
jgi:hypothetical protein